MKMINKKYCVFNIVLIFFVIQSCADDEILNPEKEPSDPDPPQTNIRFVPQQFSSIQSAINASNNNDTILVSPGTYYENLNLIGKNIVVKSSGSADNTIIDGSQPIDQNNSSVVKFVTAEDSITATLDGFTITGGSGSWSWPGKVGGGIWIENAQAVIKNCIIKNNYAVKGGGIYIGYDLAHSYLNKGVLINSVIVNNTSQYEGGGIYGGMIINYCTIAYNTSVNSYKVTKSFNGSGVIKSLSSIQITNSIIWDGAFPLYSGWDINYCDVKGGWETGVGNINSDPMFCNSQLGNYYLASNSPCVGAGENGTNIGALGTCGQEYSRFDYPLEIGTTWKYSYSFSYSHFGEWWYRKGIHFWTVVDSSTLSNDIVRFSIKSVNYDSTASNYNPTIRHIIDSLIFYIDVGVDVVVVRPPSYVNGIEDNIQGYFSGSDSIKIGGRTYTEQIGLTNMLHENLTNTFYREKQQLIEFNKKRK